MFFVLSQAWDKDKILSPRGESNLRPSDSALRCTYIADPSSMQDVCYKWTLWWALLTRVYFFTELKKHTILLILFTEHDAIGIADPSSMQYACHI